MSLRTTRRRSSAALAALVGITLALAAYSGVALGSGHGKGRGKGPQRFAIGLFGDMPYSAQGKAEYPALLKDINENDVATTSSPRGAPTWDVSPVARAGASQVRRYAFKDSA